MRVDISAHVGHWPFRRLPHGGCAALLERMLTLGIDSAWIANLNGLFYQNPQQANDELAGWLSEDPRARGQLLPFAVLNPTYPDWREDLAVCRKRHGFRGVRLYPQYHDYMLTAPALAEFLRVAESEQIPVAFSLRMVDARGRSWLDTKVVEGETEQLRLEALTRVVSRFARLRWMVIQGIFEQLSSEAVAVLKGADVLFDTSRATTCGIAGPNSYDLRTEQKRFGAAKFAFGSMTPFSDPVSPVLRVTSGSLSATELDAVFAANARRFLSL